MIYSDAYLFDLASEMLDRDVSTIDVHEHLVRVCKIDDERATRIVSLAFDPSGYR